MSKIVSRRDVLVMTAGGLGGAVMAAPLVRAAAPEQKVTLYVFRGEQGIKGPDGKGHDTFVPSSFVVKAGVPVQLEVINYDEMPHTITAPALKLNVMINPGKTVGDNVTPVTTKASFTLARRGVYRWYCSMACDGGAGGWAMTNGFAGPDREGFMAGNIVVI